MDDDVTKKPAQAAIHQAADQMLQPKNVRRAPSRESALIQAQLAQMVTRDEFNDALKALADTLSALDDAIEHRTDRLAALLVAIRDRMPAP